MPSDLESGSERENVLSIFHNHPDLTLPGEHIDLDELLLDDPRNFIYELDREFSYPSFLSEVEHNKYSTESAIEINRSDPYLKEQGILLEALITHTGILEGIYLKEKYIEIVDARNSANTYLQKDTENPVNHLAVVRLPENFDSKKLQKSVDVAVSILKDAIVLQERILSKAARFGSDRF